MSSSRRPAGRGTSRVNRPSVLTLEGRALLAASPRLDAFALPGAFSEPGQIVEGPGGDLWFGEGTGKIGRITPRGQVTEFPLPTPAGGQVPAPSALAAGPDGNLWAIDSANDTIDRVGQDGRVATFPIPPGQMAGQIGSIVAGADGNLWFTAGFSNATAGFTATGLPDDARVPGTIDRITPEGVLTRFSLPLGGGFASSLAAGPGGVWFTDPLAGRVGEIDYSGRAVEYAGLAPYYDLAPSPLAVGPDGDAYYYAQSGPTSMYGATLSSFLVKVAPGGAMTRIAVPASVSSNLLSGPDGIDFLPRDDSSYPTTTSLDRLNPDGSVSTLSTDPALASASGVTLDPDGDLWLTQALPGQIDRLDLSATPEPEPGPTLVASPLVANPFGPVAPGTGGAAPVPTAPAGEASSLVLAEVRSSAGVTVTSATVDWGDSSAPTAGTLGPDPLGQYDTAFVDALVSAPHAYAKAGSYTVTVTIDGTGPAGAAMTASVVETVSAVDPTPSPQPPLALTAGESIDYLGPLAIFSTPTPHDSAGSDFTATVDWGDGSAAAVGMVGGGYEQASPLVPTQFIPDLGSGPATLFQVSGDHTYATAGTHTVEVTLTDRSGRTATGSASIRVAAGPLEVDPASPLLATADPTPASSWSGADDIDLGTLTDFLGGVAGRVDSVTVDWGDGSAPTAGSLSPSSTVAAPTGPVTDDVEGTHAYARAGDYTARITADDHGGDVARATTTIHVSAGRLAVDPPPLSSYSGTAGEPIPAGPLVMITAPVSADPPSDFTATIGWGDGSTPTAGTVGTVAAGPVILPLTATLQVSGDHTYAEPGLYQVTVTVDGPDGSTARAATTVSISWAGVTLASPGAPGFTAGVAGAPAVLGSFWSGSAGSTPADFKATVDWGDGSPLRPATIRSDATGQLASGGFQVLGGHDYARAGSYAVTVTVVGTDGIPGVITGQATVGAPVKVTPPTVALVASRAAPIYGQRFTGIAAVTTSAGQRATGTVQFYVDGAPFGAPVALSGGAATSPSLAGLGAGTHHVSASYSGDANDAATTSAVLTASVAPAPLLIVANTASKRYGASDPPIFAAGFGFVLGQSLASLSGHLVVATAATAGSHVGAYPVVPGGLTSPNYAITYVDGTMAVAPAPLLIRADGQARVYGQPDFPLTASYTGFVNGDSPASLTTPVTLATTANPFGAVGSYAIVAAGATSPDYAISFRPGILDVIPPPSGATPLALARAAGVTTLYEEILGRAPDAAGFGLWVAALGRGTPLSAVARAFWASPERSILVATNRAPRIALATAIRDAQAAGRVASWLDWTLPKGPLPMAAARF